MEGTGAQQRAAAARRHGSNTASEAADSSDVQRQSSEAATRRHEALRLEALWGGLEAHWAQEPGECKATIHPKES